MKHLYFDHSAASYPSSEVVKAKQRAEETYYASPVAPYKLAQESLSSLRKAYESIYDLVGADTENQLIMCASGAEAVNQVLWSVYYKVTREEGKNHFLTSQVDEAPAILGIERIAHHFACTVDQIPVDANGLVTKERLIESMSPKTALISLSFGSGILGTYHDLKEILQVCKERGVLVHLDVTHALGKVPIRFDQLEIDYLTFQAEQIHGPKSVGVIVAKSDAPNMSLVVGGAEQKGRRGGTWDVPAIVGTGVACDQAKEYLSYMGMELALIRDRFEEKVKQRIPGAMVHFVKSNRLPHISCISFPFLNNDALLYRLSQKGVAASFGGGNFQQIALLLEACGVEKPLAKGALSFAFSRWHTHENIDELIEILVSEVGVLRGMATYFEGAQ